MAELKRLVGREKKKEGEKDGEGSQASKPSPVLGRLDETTIETMLAAFIDPFFEHIKDFRNK